MTSYKTDKIAAFTPDVLLAIDDANRQAAARGIDITKFSLYYTISQVDQAWFVILSIGGTIHAWSMQVTGSAPVHFEVV